MTEGPGDRPHSDGPANVHRTARQYGLTAPELLSALEDLGFEVDFELTGFSETARAALEQLLARGVSPGRREHWRAMAARREALRRGEAVPTRGGPGSLPRAAPARAPCPGLLSGGTAAPASEPPAEVRGPAARGRPVEAGRGLGAEEPRRFFVFDTSALLHHPGLLDLVSVDEVAVLPGRVVQELEGKRRERKHTWAASAALRTIEERRGRKSNLVVAGPGAGASAVEPDEEILLTALRYPAGRTTLVTGDVRLRLAALARGVEARTAEELLQGAWRGRAGKLRP